MVMRCCCCCWVCLILLRFVWTCLPQSGYIHPDEFFQSAEIAAGDILGVEAVRTWEFNSTFPLRSIIPIYLSAGLPLLLLRAASTCCGRAITWYSVIVSVRLWVTLLSLITDVAAARLARWAGTDAAPAAVVTATSYVSLVYFTRTFSNTLEAFLFAALLLLVAKHSWNSFQAASMSAVIVVGVFNRPTFAVYATMPYIWWLFCDGVDKVLIKALNSLLAAVPVAALLAVCDSVYFGRLSFNELLFADHLDLVSLVTRNLTVTPLNFLRYNTQLGNLAEHGIHPRFTHVVVNIPLLFGVLGILLFSSIVAAVSATFRCDPVPVSRRWKMLVLSCVIPISLLSMFPHQEPRFLIPLLPVLAALFAHRIRSVRWIGVWLLCNVSCCLFYGCVHQAGLIPCLAFLQQTTNVTVPRHVVFWHTYTAPQHLLLIDHQSLQTSSIRGSATSLKSLEGSPVGDLVDHLLLIDRSYGISEEAVVMVAAPSCGHQGLLCQTAQAGIRLELRRTFWPHLSTEHLPTYEDLTCQTSTGDVCHHTATHYDNVECRDKGLLLRIKSLTALNLYTVTFS